MELERIVDNPIPVQQMRPVQPVKKVRALVVHVHTMTPDVLVADIFKNFLWNLWCLLAEIEEVIRDQNAISPRIRLDIMDIR